MRSTHLPTDALRLLQGVEARWWIAGGWAIDLWLGGETREHADLDIAILRREQRAFWELLAGWDLHVATAPDVVEPWTQRDVVPTPLHAVWCRPTPDSEWAFELLLNDAKGDDWLFRRDHGVRMPLAAIGDTSTELPHLNPEIVLLYKAKSVRETDQADFDHARARLDASARAWLRTALERVHPGHAWLADLT
jgi:hypothetical protein